MVMAFFPFTSSGLFKTHRTFSHPFLASGVCSMVIRQGKQLIYYLQFKSAWKIQNVHMQKATLSQIETHDISFLPVDRIMHDNYLHVVLPQCIHVSKLHVGCNKSIFSKLGTLNSVKKPNLYFQKEKFIKIKKKTNDKHITETYEKELKFSK